MLLPDHPAGPRRQAAGEPVPARQHQLGVAEGEYVRLADEPVPGVEFPAGHDLPVRGPVVPAVLDLPEVRPGGGPVDPAVVADVRVSVGDQCQYRRLGGVERRGGLRDRLGQQVRPVPVRGPQPGQLPRVPRMPGRAEQPPGHVVVRRQGEDDDCVAGRVVAAFPRRDGMGVVAGGDQMLGGQPGRPGQELGPAGAFHARQQGGQQRRHDGRPRPRGSRCQRSSPSQARHPDSAQNRSRPG
jgi:hypothetical protein